MLAITRLAGSGTAMVEKVPDVEAVNGAMVPFAIARGTERPEKPRVKLAPPAPKRAAWTCASPEEKFTVEGGEDAERLAELPPAVPLNRPPVKVMVRTFAGELAAGREAVLENTMVPVYPPWLMAVPDCVAPPVAVGVTVNDMKRGWETGASRMVANTGTQPGGIAPVAPSPVVDSVVVLPDEDATTGVRVGFCWLNCRMAAASAEAAIAREANAEKAIRSGEIFIATLLQVGERTYNNLGKVSGPRTDIHQRASEFRF